MGDTTLTVDAVLGLLDRFEGEEAVDIELGDDSDITTSLALLEDQPQVTKPDRFKRARETKKNELADLRTHVSELELILRELKQQQRRRFTSSQPGVWQLTALRQEQERREAELLNNHLRATVHATVKRARLLKSLLHVPDTLSALVHHKRLSQQDVASFVADAVELQGVMLAVDLMEIQAATTLAPTQDYIAVLEPRQYGCGLVMESANSCVLPYGFSSVSANAWQLLALGGTIASTKSPMRKPSDEASSQVSRMYTMEILNGGMSIAYKGTYVYRKRFREDGGLVVSWASSWTPSQVRGSEDEGHECFRREGFVVVLPSSGDRVHSCVQVFHRVERDACGDHLCRKGAWGYASATDAELGVKDCVASEIQSFLRALDNQIVEQGSQIKPVR